MDGLGRDGAQMASSQPNLYLFVGFIGLASGGGGLSGSFAQKQAIWGCWLFVAAGVNDVVVQLVFLCFAVVVDIVDIVAIAGPSCCCLSVCVCFFWGGEGRWEGRRVVWIGLILWSYFL